MITIMNSVREPMKNNSNNSEKGLDSQFWHACAGGMVQMPPINSKVFYFPQGHAEYAQGDVDFGNSRIPALILSRISAIRYMADPETDEVYAKMRLVPVRESDFDFEDDGVVGNNNGVVENPEKPTSFAKTLTQSDANNGGGFSVPRFCAETIFPRLDYSAEPPVQTILAKDVHGEIWKFRHIYRGTPRRHLLTTGWSNFVNNKKLVAGDSIVFFRAENGDLCVGIRRAKRGIGGGPEYPCGWNTPSGNSCSQYGGYSGFSRENGNKSMEKNSSGTTTTRGRIRAEHVIEAATLAVSGQPFEVVYYPRASTPEFCVKASSVRAAMQIRWCSGIRFKMPFETEDSSRISWFMGTISSVHHADPRWPDSPWRILQVAWDEPDLLQNVRCVSPWLVELVSSIPAIDLSPYSPPRKKLRLQQYPDYSLIGQLPMPSVYGNFLNSSNTLCHLSDNIPAGIQGARQAHFGLSSSNLFNKRHSGLIPVGFQQLGHVVPPGIPGGNFMRIAETNEDSPCCVTEGIPYHNLKDNDEIKTPHIFLFGQLIVSGQQMSKSSSGDDSSSDPEKTGNSSDGSGSALHRNGSVENCSDGGSPWDKDHQKSDHNLETGLCKVYVESGDAGTLDLSVFRSYQELYRKLANMFGKENSEMLSNVLYRDATGAVRHTGDEPFSEFLKTARGLYMA